MEQSVSQINSKEILKFCLEQGLLMDNEVLASFNEVKDINFVKTFLSRIKDSLNQRFITKKLFFSNKEKISEIFLSLPVSDPFEAESLKIKFGLDSNFSENLSEEEIYSGEIKVSSIFYNKARKLEVNDFTKYFRGRVLEMKGILQDNSSLKNLVSINKLSGNRQSVSIIGIVSDKKVTKNNNIIFEVEDLTGKIKILINGENKELCEKADEVTLDSVLGFSGFGSREIIFANNLIFPECSLPERKKSPVEEQALFLGDIHYGSKLFLEKNFLDFIDYVNNHHDAKNVRYIFIAGDLIAGVGIYPGQEKELLIPDIEEQFIGLSKLLTKIRSDVKIIISPGNHDGVRLMEPQPFLNEKYAWSLFNIKNIILTGNPSLVNIGAVKNFSGFEVLTYHGMSYHYYSNNISRLIKENALIKSPDKIIHYLLKNRHLAPTHASAQYFPSEEDYLIIKKIPDIIVSGHMHKSAVSYHNNILVISTSSWESKTPYQEKMGNEPDFCKVPMFNLKTREIKILDFEEKDGN